VTDIWVLLGAGRADFRRDRVVLVFGESELLRDLRACRQFLGLGAAEGCDTRHLKGSLMKLRRCAGYLRACHSQQAISATARTGERERWADVRAGCVNRPGRRKWRVAASN
jgi:hypothetical protein